MGSHGGWIHDYYGTNASESNAAEFLPYLVLNRNAIEAVIKRPIREYSAPEGNNPLWSLNWLTGNGVGSYYSLSHTGTAPTLSYRGGKVVAPSLWAIPVMPFGVAATFEEFDDLGIAPATLGDGSVWDIAFSPDPEQRFIYLADGKNMRIYIIERETL